MRFRHQSLRPSTKDGLKLISYLRGKEWECLCLLVTCKQGRHLQVLLCRMKKGEPFPGKKNVGVFFSFHCFSEVQDCVKFNIVRDIHGDKITYLIKGCI